LTALRGLFQPVLERREGKNKKTDLSAGPFCYPPLLEPDGEMEQDACCKEKIGGGAGASHGGQEPDD
jgi:hypothetical protein